MIVARLISMIGLTSEVEQARGLQSTPPILLLLLTPQWRNWNLDPLLQSGNGLNRYEGQFCEVSCSGSRSVVVSI